MEKNFFVAPAPYFFSEIGHYLSYHKELQEALTSLGFDIKTYIPKECAVQGLGQNWINHFSFRGNKLVLLCQKFVDYSKILLIMRKKKKRKILFLESYAVIDMIALICALVFFSGRKIEVWQLFRDGLEWNKPKQKLYIYFARALRLFSPYKSLTDSEVVQKTLNQYKGFDLTVLSIPHTFAEKANAVRKSSDKFHLWLPGTARFDKGTANLVKLSKSLDQNLQKLALWIEKNPENDFSKEHLTINHVAPGISREAYEDILKSVDALVLPYDPIRYISRTSGPFVEAICYGKMVFTQEGNWLAYELKKFGLEECILDWCNPFVATKIVELLTDESIYKKFQKMQQAYLAFHNQKSFTKILGDLLVKE